MIENLNALRDKAYKIAVEHGWHEEEKSSQHWLMLIISELSEVVEADRLNGYARADYFKEIIANSNVCKGLDPEIPSEEGFRVHFEETIKDTVEDELADVVIRTLDYAGHLNIDLDSMPNPFCGELNQDLVKLVDGMSVTEWAFDCTSILTNHFSKHDGLRNGYIVVFLHRVWLLCRKLHIDLEWFILQKMEYNRHREYKHGKKY